MNRKLGQFLHHRPSLKDALLWALPAILFGALLRFWLCDYSPFAYWGSDSESYYYFVYKIGQTGEWDIPEKREHIYPYFLGLVSLFPGAPLRWLLLAQHGLGLLTLVPLAYAVRKTLAHWRLVIIPVTLLYAGFPIILWYEHEMLGEAFFSATLVWAFAGWVLWQTRQERGASRPTDWWFFLIPFALCVLTKPSGRFFWPGIVLGLIYLKAWRYFSWPQWLGTALLCWATFTVGDSSQGARLLYSSFFPLTQLESGKHQELKAEIAPLVREYRASFDTYYLNDAYIKGFLKGEYKDEPGFENWTTLAKEKDKKKLPRVMKSLALEAILAEPYLTVKHVVSRVVGSLDLFNFKLRRFEPDYFVIRYEEDYAKMKPDSRNVHMLNEALGLPRSPNPPTPEVFRALTAPPAHSPEAERIMKYVATFNEVMNFTQSDVLDRSKVALQDVRPTVLGWYFIAGLAGALCIKRYRGSLGVWLVIALGYAFGVHLVGSMNPRFCLPVWPVFYVLLALPIDAVVGLTRQLVKRPNAGINLR